MATRKLLGAGAIIAAFTLSTSCGGGGSGGFTPPPPAANVAALTVDSGPAALPGPSMNTLFTSVTVCVPGSTSSCQTIDHVQVDTGSYGLRLLASTLTVMLPVQPIGNASLVECTSFADGFSWGPVALADVQIGGEVASSLPVQVIGDSRFTTIPANCSSLGREEDTVTAFGANGLLGIGVFAQDCGAQCAAQATPWYYTCSATACQQTPVLLVDQVTNPIVKFAVDNNGSTISLPSVAAAGAATVSGTLIFGIDTQANNQSGTQTLLTVDPNTALLTTVFAGQTLSGSFIDSGSNGMFFNGNVQVCPNTPSNPNGSDFYCPGATQAFTAGIVGVNGVTSNQTFSVGNAQTMVLNQPTFTAFPLLAGPLPSSSNSFDWGLPFFYGRKVTNALEGRTTSAGTGPYIAF